VSSSANALQEGPKEEIKQNMTSKKSTIVAE
jgi:hypothetical protein